MFVGKARRSLPFLVALGLLVALGCARAQSPAQPAPGPAEQKLGQPQQAGPSAAVRGGLLNITGNDPIGFDPHATTAARTTQNVTMALEGLTQIIQREGDRMVEQGDIRIIPLLAESWEQKSDTEFVFKLRQGVKFKDNKHTLQAVPGGLLKDREMTADDMVYSYKRAANPLQTTRETNWKAQAIREVEALDRYTVRVKLRQPYAPILVYISGNPFWIVPHEIYEKWGNMKRVDAVVGTGPFIVEEYKPGVIVRFRKNPDYYQKGLPYLDGLDAPIKFAESSLASFRAGKLDAAGVAWGNLASLLKSNPDVQVKRSLPNGEGRFVAYREDQKPFDDVRVRRAIAMAMDYDGYVASRCGKYADLGCKAYPYHGTVPVAVKGWYLPPEEWPAEYTWWTYNPQRAKELLAEAGYPNGFDTILNVGGADYYGAGSTEDWDIAYKWLADIGIRTTMKSKLYTLYATSTWLGDYEGIAGPSGAHSYTEPNDLTYRHFFPGAPGNVSHTDDPVMTKMLLAQLGEYDVAKRQQIVKEISKRNLEMVHKITWPQAWIPGSTGYQPWINDYSTNLAGGCWGNRGTEYTNLWIDPSKKPQAALTITGDGQKIVAANPQGLGVSNPLGRTSGQC